MRKFASIIVVVVALWSCMPVIPPYVPPADAPATYEWEVRYRVSGTAPTVSATLSNATGGTEQFSGVAVPVEYTYAEFSDWFVYISAQNESDSGSVTAEIFYRDELIESATSEGAYVIATASGSI